ncbi:NAD-dependent epimerase/dehydratase family protein [Deinococcus maricopensis]|uniref:NAD-dependent epimerase/dehydratase n=1 Tax=Deinococcus maricopensis (strain DSM 21211 / LMG 22137 / NRRL B-23946 / LB-34) TaxID=709986 RepID=E8U452_DEIML|nr:NAD-dependent epimerase/dehydratase family protein [Deinococcus maricopensis]ADV65889.1 NAD-dependent epimerase/dehydratase [Deinococcus maricopensis DSM 21211]
MVIVTGATGHLGAALIRALRAQERPVRALIRQDRRALEGLDVECAPGDLHDERALRRAFEGGDVVYHVAAHIALGHDAWPTLHAVNVHGTRNVVNACLAAGVRRLVHVSSVAALVGKPHATPVDEARPLVSSPHPFPYGYSKALAEQEVQRGLDAGLDAVIVRPTAILGPYDHRVGSTTQLVRRAALGEMPVALPGGFDFVDVRDVADGALRAETRAPRGADFILSGTWASTLDVARRAAALTGARPPAARSHYGSRTASPA